jgi:hypothetical protein
VRTVASSSCSERVSIVRPTWAAAARAAAIWSAVTEVDEPVGRWGHFDREGWGSAIPELVGREPLSYPDAVVLALS